MVQPKPYCLLIFLTFTGKGQFPQVLTLLFTKLKVFGGTFDENVSKEHSLTFGHRHLRRFHAPYIIQVHVEVNYYFQKSSFLDF